MCRRARIGNFLVVLALSVAGCTTDEAESELSSVGCLESTMTGCQMVAVSFREPITLEAVQLLIADWPGRLHGVWRSDWICIESEGTGFLNEENPASRFAYLGAATVPGRVTAMAPPVTDGGSSRAVWQQRIEALARLSDELVGAAMWLPLEWEIPTNGRIVETQVVPHRFTYGAAKILYIGEPGYGVDPVVDLDFDWIDTPPDCVTGG